MSHRRQGNSPAGSGMGIDRYADGCPGRQRAAPCSDCAGLLLMPAAVRFASSHSRPASNDGYASSIGMGKLLANTPAMADALLSPYAFFRAAVIIQKTPYLRRAVPPARGHPPGRK